jgi:hypothetical protein
MIGSGTLQCRDNQIGECQRRADQFREGKPLTGIKLLKIGQAF